MPYCQFCGSPLAPLAPAQLQPVRGIGIAAAIMLGVDAVAEIALLPLRVMGSSAQTALAIVAGLLVVATFPVFIVWFSRVRQNAGVWGAQRRSQGWAVGAWFTPVVNLWFPYEIAADAADQHEADPGGRGTLALVRAWWTCWILAWVTGFHTFRTTGILPDGSTGTMSQVNIWLGGTSVSCVITAAAAVLALLVVRRLSASQEARIAAMASGAYYHPGMAMPPVPPGPSAPPFIAG
jgi:hypothetical protein